MAACANGGSGVRIAALVFGILTAILRIYPFIVIGLVHTVLAILIAVFVGKADGAALSTARSTRSEATGGTAATRPTPRPRRRLPAIRFAPRAVSHPAQGGHGVRLCAVNHPPPKRRAASIGRREARRQGGPRVSQAWFACRNGGGLRPSPEGAGDHRRARARAALRVSRSYR